MRAHFILAVWVGCLSCLSCNSHHSEMTEVWVGKGLMPVDIAAPAGFVLTPEEARQRVWESRRLSLKHVWHIYADGENYYIMDSFLGSSRRAARRQGVCLDGQTGDFLN